MECISPSHRQECLCYISRLIHEGIFHRFRVSVNHCQAGAHRAFQAPAASNPKNLEGSADALEVIVTRDEGCLPGVAEGGEAGGRERALLEAHPERAFWEIRASKTKGLWFKKRPKTLFPDASLGACRR
jgi:hypothetical protein